MSRSLRRIVTPLGGHCPLGWLFACLVGSACQNEYPIEPTPCDDWCHATQDCGWSNPAECVAGCEAEGLVPKSPECRALWDEALRCFNALPEGQVCRTMVFGEGEADCTDEELALRECVGREALE